LLKDMDADKMIAAIRDTAAGQFVLPASVAAKSVARMKWMTENEERTQKNRSNGLKLTEREEELARLIITG